MTAIGEITVSSHLRRMWEISRGFMDRCCGRASHDSALEAEIGSISDEVIEGRKLQKANNKIVLRTW